MSEREGGQVLGLEDVKGGTVAAGGMKEGGWAQGDRGGATHGFKVSGFSRTLQGAFSIGKGLLKAFPLVIQCVFLFSSFSE